MAEKDRSHYYSTYFNKDLVLKLSKVSTLFAWIILIFYSVQWLLQVVVFFMQYARGFWVGMGFTDIAQNIFWLLEQPIRGLVYFAVLYCVAQVLLMIMDIENNTHKTGTIPVEIKNNITLDE